MNPNPSNDFTDFFTAKTPPKGVQNFKPPIPAVVESMLGVIANKGEMYYADAQLRFEICCALSYCAHMIRDPEMAKELNVFSSGVLMLVTMQINETYEEYAGEEERNRFGPPRDSEEDSDED